MPFGTGSTSDTVIRIASTAFAAGSEHLQPSLRGERLGGGDHVLREQRRARPGVGDCARKRESLHRFEVEHETTDYFASL